MQIRPYIGADKPAVILYPSGTVISFDELEARANRLAHWFRQAGLREDDVVAILMENNEHVHAVMWAARRSGLYYVPINTHLTASEAAYIVDNSGAKAIVGSAALRETCHGLAEHLPGGLPDLLMLAGGGLVGWMTYPECVADQPDTPIEDEREGDLLQYSSGTTGRPKGIKRELPHVSPDAAPGMMPALLDFWMAPGHQLSGYHVALDLVGAFTAVPRRTRSSSRSRRGYARRLGRFPSRPRRRTTWPSRPPYRSVGRCRTARRHSGSADGPL